MCTSMSWFPHGLENMEKWENFLSRLEKSGNFTQNTGENREFDPKYWKSEEILASFFSLLIEVYLLNKFLYLLSSLNRTLKNTGKLKEHTEKVRDRKKDRKVMEILSV